MGSIGWLGGYTLVSMVVAFIVTRLFEAVFSPFLIVGSRLRRLVPFSSGRGRRSR